MNSILNSVLKTLFGALWLVSTVAAGQQPAGDQARGPLRVHPTNPRYFTDGARSPDGSLRAVYLTGSHTWNNRRDIGRDDPPKAFDFDAYLDFLERHGHNFIRLWAWDSALWDTRSALEWVEEGAIYHVAPQPWRRTGPGQAPDGKPKFNLEQFDPAYFERLRSRVQAAGRRGIYVSVMLFEGWALSFDPTSWRGHPFRRENNVQGINGDPNGDGRGLEIQTLTIPRITAAQEAYVRKVIDTVNDLDNVLYEVSNEARLLNPASSTKDWQYHMIRFIKNEEAKKGRRHPVGMTSQGGGGGDDSEILRRGPADWISPNPDRFDYKNNPPASDGAKVVLLDTDHLWGVGGDAAWVWKSFLRGHNPLFMDPYEHDILGKGRPDQWEGARRALGTTRGLAMRIDLAKMTPAPDLASTRYCLANPGHEYLVYQPGSGEFSVNLATGNHAFEWFDPAKGSVASTGSVKTAGGNQAFTPPFSGPAVLYLKGANAKSEAASNATPTPKLGIFADKFTIGGKPTFLLGVSYFDALGWSDADLDALQARRFNLIRIFLDWSILAIKDNNPSPLAPRGFLNPDGSLKSAEKLLDLVRACAARGIMVDVTILTAIYDAANPTSKTLDMPSRERAVRNAVRLLKNEPNVFFDVCNEHDVAYHGETTTLTHDEVATLIRAVLAEHPAAIVTVSSGGDHLPNAQNIREELAAGVMVVTPHFQRNEDWYDRTDDRVKAVKEAIRSAQRVVPVYLQEEQRRGWGTWSKPPRAQFIQAAREAVAAGAAGWVFHTYAGFDLRSKSLLENLDSVEREVLDSLGVAVFGEAKAQSSNSPVGGPLRAHPVLHRDGVFTIRSVDRAYDLHRTRPVTTLTIEHRDWPGNWFCLWLPETVYEDGTNVWSNFTGGERTQRWTTELKGRLTSRMRIGRFELVSTLTPDAENNALWLSHTFHNTSGAPLRELTTQSCFHMVDAPQFISAFGERIWAKLDGEWRTTDQVGRLASPDPRRVKFCRQGLRPARVVIPSSIFPSAELLEEAHHPLIIAEAFGGKGAVGIGQRDYQHLFNNNDPILRCIHSEPKPIASLEPGAQAAQEGLIVFDRGDHAALVKQWERLARKRWERRRKRSCRDCGDEHGASSALTM